MAPWPLKPIC